MTTERYVVVAKSRSGHCCFTASVVDTKRPTMFDGKHFNGEFDAVCECFESEDAEHIALVLNAVESSQ